MFGTEEIVNRNVDTGFKNMSEGNPAFNCKNCGVLHHPRKDFWIFHNLCDDCFFDFDMQKMKGRLNTSKGRKVTKYFEDSDEWVKSRKQINKLK